MEAELKEEEEEERRELVSLLGGSDDMLLSRRWPTEEDEVGGGVALPMGPSLGLNRQIYFVKDRYLYLIYTKYNKRNGQTRTSVRTLKTCSRVSPTD